MSARVRGARDLRRGFRILGCRANVAGRGFLHPVHHLPRGGLLPGKPRLSPWSATSLTSDGEVKARCIDV